MNLRFKKIRMNTLAVLLIILFMLLFQNSVNFFSIEIKKYDNFSDKLKISTDDNQLWNYTTGDAIYSSAALGDINGNGKIEVIIGSNDGKVYAFHGENGTIFWNYTTGGLIRCSPTIGDIDGNGKVEVIIGSGDKNLYALHGENGTIFWNYTTGEEIRSCPTFGDLDGNGKVEVIVGSKDNKTYAFHGENGTLF